MEGDRTERGPATVIHTDKGKESWMKRKKEMGKGGIPFTYVVTEGLFVEEMPNEYLKEVKDKPRGHLRGKHCRQRRQEVEACLEDVRISKENRAGAESGRKAEPWDPHQKGRLMVETQDLTHGEMRSS